MAHVDIIGTQHYALGIGQPKSDIPASYPALFTDSTGTALQKPDGSGSIEIGSGGGGGMVTGRTVAAAAATGLLGDAGTVVYANFATAVTFTIPNDTTVVWPADTVIGLYQVGVGVPAFAAGAGVTLRSPAGIAAAVQYAHIFARKVGANEWALI